MENKKKKKRIILGVIAVIIAAGLAYSFSGGSGQNEEIEEARITAEERSMEVSLSEPAEEKAKPALIYVDVEGAVNEPQVVCLDEGARVFQAIEAAGGKREDADLRSINLAAVCEDGQKIYLPTEEEAAEQENSGNGQAGISGTAEQSSDRSAGVGGLVNINTAGTDELQTLSGVGPGIAQRIIDYRSQNGAFHSIEDLKQVSGIGDKIFDKLKEHICV